MSAANYRVLLPAIALLAGGASGADELRVAMEKHNVAWLDAFNQPRIENFPGMYTADAVLMPPGGKPIQGPQAIAEWWGSRYKAGAREHTFDLLETRDDGKLAYQSAQWTAVFVKESGERTPYTGNSLRVFEKQPDGQWKIKVHIYNRH